MPRTHKPLERPGAFRCDEDALRNVWRTVSETQDKAPRITVEASDGSTLFIDDIEGLLAFRNARRRTINSIVIEAQKGDGVTAQIRWKGGSIPWIATYVSGEDKEVLYLHSQLWEILKSCEVWFRMVHFGGVRFVTSFLMGVPGLIYLGRGWYGTATILMWGALIIASPLVNWLFPPHSFLTGDGVRRWDNAKSARSVIGTVVVLGAIVSFVTGLILYKFTSHT